MPARHAPSAGGAPALLALAAATLAVPLAAPLAAQAPDLQRADEPAVRHRGTASGCTCRRSAPRRAGARSSTRDACRGAIPLREIRTMEEWKSLTEPAARRTAQDLAPIMDSLPTVVDRRLAEDSASVRDYQCVYPRAARRGTPR